MNKTFSVALLATLLETTNAIALNSERQSNTKWDGRFVGNSWESQTGKQKVSEIWKKINENTTSGTFEHYANLPNENVMERFPYYGDELPCFGDFCRGKPVYASGMHAKVRWESVGSHNYTGLFEGADNAILRIAGQLPVWKDQTFMRLKPGVAIKMFRDGMDSVNLLMSAEFFTAQNYNILGQMVVSQTEGPEQLEPDQICLVAANNWTNQASFYASSSPSYMMADFDQRGELEKEPNWPFKIAMKPRDFDFPEDTYDETYEEYLTRIEADTVLYDVYAWNKYKKDDPGLVEELIGQIKLVTPFTRSLWGDTKLYFKHTRYEEELVRKPEWVSLAPQTPIYPLTNEMKIGIAMQDPIRCPFAKLYEDYLQYVTA